MNGNGVDDDDDQERWKGQIDVRMCQPKIFPMWWRTINKQTNKQFEPVSLLLAHQYILIEQ